MSAQDPVSRVDAYLRRRFAVEDRDYSGNLKILTLAGTVEINPHEIVRIAREEPKVADVRVGHYGELP